MDSGEFAPKTDSSRRRLALAGAALALLTLAAYGNSFRGSFLFDDIDAIPNNPTIWHLWPLTQVLAPPPETTVNDRPILNFSLALNYAVSGNGTWSYHVLNLIIHIGAGLALFGIVRRTLLWPVLRERFGEAALPVAFCSALIWLLHPVQTQCVAYIVQRGESLMGMFYLLTVYFFIRGIQGESPSYAPLRGAMEGEKTGRRTLWLWLSWGACLFGMGAKEVMVTAPVLVLLYDRTFVSGSFRESWRRHRGYYCALAVTWLAYIPIVVAGGRRDPSSGFGSGVTFWVYARTQFQAIGHYIRVSLWPSRLMLLYEPGGWIKYPHLLDPRGFVPYALLIAPILVATALALWRRPVIGFLGAWFFGILAPTSLIPAAGETMADRRLYLPLAAIVIPLVATVYVWLGKRSLPAFLAAAAVLGWMTERRNRVYGSGIALWSAQVAERPHDSLSHQELGAALTRLGRTDEAIAEYQTALRLDPGWITPLNNMGAALALQRRFPEAIGYYERALRVRPGNIVSEVNLANALRTVGRDSEALALYRKAYGSKSTRPEDNVALGDGLAALGRPAEAIACYEMALRSRFDTVEAHRGLGVVLQSQGRTEAAIDQFTQALRLKPDAPDLYTHLGLALCQAGRPAEAIPQLKEALRLKPDYAEAHDNLGIALGRAGRLSDSIQEFQAAIRIKPYIIDAHFNLAVSLWKAGRADEARAELATANRLKTAAALKGGRP